MYTDCPGCQRQFHVYAAQLSAARGLVKCGFCGQKFNALERLHDKPISRTVPAPTHIPEPESLEEPEFVIPDQNNEELPEQEEQGIPEYFVADPDSAAEGPGIFGIDLDAADSDKDSPENRGHTSGADWKSDVSVTGRKLKSTPSSAAAYRGTTGDNDLAAALLETQAVKPGWINRLLWGSGVLLMVIFAASQLIWFNRDAIMSRYRETIPWFNMLCEKINCDVIRNRDPAAIALINRDVRNHPRYKNALLVNATMSNRSQTLQAYPVVQLNLFDTDEKLIAYRQFQPDEYLDESINILRGMPPNVPVHFVLEVLDPATGAVGFEFEFH